jgi:hypothetical protein
MIGLKVDIKTYRLQIEMSVRGAFALVGRKTAVQSSMTEKRRRS